MAAILTFDAEVVGADLLPVTNAHVPIPGGEGLIYALYGLAWDENLPEGKTTDPRVFEGYKKIFQKIWSYANRAYLTPWVYDIDKASPTQGGQYPWKDGDGINVPLGRKIGDQVDWTTVFQGPDRQRVEVRYWLGVAP